MQTEKNMAGPYEIIVLDLDGTLTNRDKVITPRTKAALMKAQERGKKVVLASGRPTQGVMPLAKELRLDEYSGYILSFNGGRIINCKTGETVFARSLPVSAGVMPIVKRSQIERTVALSSASLPSEFTRMVSRFQDDPDSLYEAGIEYAVNQLRDLIEGGADGVHLYAMNDANVAAKVYEGIKDLL